MRAGTSVLSESHVSLSLKAKENGADTRYGDTSQHVINPSNFHDIPYFVPNRMLYKYKKKRGL